MNPDDTSGAYRIRLAWERFKLDFYEGLLFFFKRRCRAHSPEGLRCGYREGHGGLHMPRRGRRIDPGFAWGGDANA